MKHFIAVLILLLLTINYTNAQEHMLNGKIYDSKTNENLSYVTIKIADSSYGTTSDKNGEYMLRLSNGFYKVVFSYIGFFTDTIDVMMEDNNIERNVFLDPSEIFTKEILVVGEDPAYEIIREAIKYKKEFMKKLNEYEFDAYSKLVIRSSVGAVEDEKQGDKSKEKDKLNILGILESESKVYFRKPDQYKQIVKAKRETANITRSIVFPYIINFYEESIDLGEVQVPSPLADDTFDNYEFKLQGTTSIDSTIIYKIKVTNQSEVVPQFYGELYISDSIFALRKVDLHTNNAARLQSMENIEFLQKFTAYDDTKDNVFWLPSDVQMYADGTFAGFIDFEAEFYTIVSNYEINKKAPPGIFNKYVIKISPDANKDSVYWRDNQLIRNTEEEKSAYQKIEKETKERDKSINLGITTINYGKYFYSYPLNFYHFNRVEGNHLQYNLHYRSKFRSNSISSYFGYGFSDKKMKYNIMYTGRFLKDQSIVLSASVFRDLQPLSYDLFGMASFYNSISGLFYKKDYYDYYYKSGYSLSLSSSYIPQLDIALRYNQEKQTTAKKNTDFSIIKPNESFLQNPNINDAFLRTVGFSLRLDPNEYVYIDWGDGSESKFSSSDLPTLDFSYDYSNKDFLKSTHDFRKYSITLNGRNNINTYLNFRYKLGADYISGEVPFQNLAYFNANTGGINLPVGFKTMTYQEYLGDKLYYLNFENNFGKLIWGNVPFIKRFNLIGFYNVGRVEIRESNRLLAAFKDFSVTEGYFHEAGFGIGGILDLFRLDFAWRLNNLVDGRNFHVVLSLDSF
ncbi:DUF5686 family protein [Bacteroidota bacterium]